MIKKKNTKHKKHTDLSMRVLVNGCWVARQRWGGAGRPALVSIHVAFLILTPPPHIPSSTPFGPTPSVGAPWVRQSPHGPIFQIYLDK